MRGRRRVRRLTDWIGGGAALETEFPVQALPQAYSLIDLQDLDEHVDRMTVIRIRGQILFQCRRDAAQEFRIGCWGIAVHTSDANGDFQNLNPAAFADQDSEDWLTRGSFVLDGTYDSTVGEFYSTGMIEVDVKAQRKMEGTQLLLLWAALDAFTPGGNDVLLWRNLRVLVKLA